MKNSSIISIERFRDAYSKVHWAEKRSKDGRYIIWAHPQNKNIWTQLPVSEGAPDYGLYSKKNVLMLLYALDIPETSIATEELVSQLSAYNYKLINRIVGKSDFRSDAVPFELATMLPQKNIEAFRHFYLTRRTNRRSLSIDRFELNHTEVGSFIIPVSVLVEEEQNATLLPIQNETNIVMHEYLKAVDTLLKIPAVTPESYAEQVLGAAIDSKTVKDFLGSSSSIAKVRSKYNDRVSDLSIGSTGSSILDFGLNESARQFTEVSLQDAIVLDEEFIEHLEKLEAESDENRVDERNASIHVVVDNIDRKGHVKLTVTSVNGTDIGVPFKAFSNELIKDKLDQFAEYFKHDGSAVVRGDITKTTGKMGRIVIDSVGPRQEDPNTQLL